MTKINDIKKQLKQIAEQEPRSMTTETVETILEMFDDNEQFALIEARHFLGLTESVKPMVFQILASNAYRAGMSSDQIIADMKRIIGNNVGDFMHRFFGYGIEKYELENKITPELIEDYGMVIDSFFKDEEITPRIINFYNAEIRWLLTEAKKSNLFNNPIIVNNAYASKEIGHASTLEDLMIDLDELVLGHLFKYESLPDGPLKDLLSQYRITEAYNYLLNKKSK